MGHDETIIFGEPSQDQKFRVIFFLQGGAEVLATNCAKYKERAQCPQSNDRREMREGQIQDASACHRPLL